MNIISLITAGLAAVLYRIVCLFVEYYRHSRVGWRMTSDREMLLRHVTLLGG